MAFTVRIQNFQSIRDVTLEVDGFTVLTGRNNSGKTATMRAILSVFTNPPIGAFLRHGESELAVEIRFEDKQWVRWEKNDKGQATYIVNGVTIQNVGRTVPPEVLALGVAPVQAGASKVWPQIAPQFTGQVFLLDLPGSALAEAISDVERVGRLNNVLKGATSDQRKTSSLLAVRRLDMTEVQAKIAAFEGLDQVGESLDQLLKHEQEADSLAARLAVIKDLQARQQASIQVVDHLNGVGLITVPSEDAAQVPLRAQRGIEVLRDLQARRLVASKVVGQLAEAPVGLLPTDSVVQEARQLGGDWTWHQSIRTRRVFALQVLNRLSEAPTDIPSNKGILEAQEAQGALRALRALRVQRAKLAGIIGAWEPPEVPSLELMGQIKGARAEYQALVAFRDRKKAAVLELASAASQLGLRRQEHERAVHEVHEILGTRGDCPTCGQEVRA